MSLSTRIQRVVDLFYLPFLRRFMDLRTFRYAFVGGANLAFGVFFYWFLFHWVVGDNNTTFFGMVTISGHILSFLINFVVTFFTGFWLTRTVAFDDSVLRGRVQLFRYSLVVGLNIAINYFGLKLLVEVCGFYPTPSYMSLQILTVIVSYLASRYYTFRC